MDELRSDLLTEGKNPVIVGISIKGTPKLGQSLELSQKVNPPTQLEFSEMAAFKKDQLVGWLTIEEGIAYNFTQGNVTSTVVNVKCPKGEKLVSVK